VKKVFLIALFTVINLFLPTFANMVKPEKVDLKPNHTIGVYQVSNEITLYKAPEDKAGNILYKINWNKNEICPDNFTFNNLFIVFMPNKSLALMNVTDETEDWVEVIYNNNTGAKGWIKKDDPYKFSTWTNFYNMYGKKYGLYILKGAPDNVKELRSGADEKSQIIARINIPTKININAIRGNWALVSVMDLDKMPKTGYIKWRNSDGIKYLFPDVK